MRTVVMLALLLGTSSLSASFAQDQGTSQSSSQPQTAPVQPERTPQQSEQARDQDRKQAEDVRVGRDWRAEEREGDRSDRMGQNEPGRNTDQIGRDRDRDERTVGRNWRMRPDEDRADRDSYGRGYYDEDRPRRRVKVCMEYENGDEFCRYR